VSPGVQEYVEARAFAHYLAHGALLPFAAAAAALAPLPLTAQDYVLGVSDVTGECMRYAIGTIPRRGGRARALALCAFVRACKAGARLASPECVR
jgi:predicted translin family RNA/ssDNA-binding protein